MKKNKAILLLSGGIDSSTLLAMVSRQNYEIYALSFDYSQRHKIELELLKKFISNYNVIEHFIVKLDLSGFNKSALTNNSVEVPKYNDSDEIGNNIPVTYVPARNTIFLSYALGFAQTIDAQDIFIGVHQEDYANYPDCRTEYIKSFEDMCNIASIDSNKKIKIHTPLINMDKTQIIKTGLEHDVDYSNTISCYDPSDNRRACGRCHACLIRIKGFKQNNIEDPASYFIR